MSSPIIPPITPVDPTPPAVVIPSRLQAQREISTGKILSVGQFPNGSPDPGIEIVSLSDAQIIRIGLPGLKILAANGVMTTDTTTYDATQAGILSEQQKDQRLATALASSKPAAIILQKFKDNTALTAGEMQQVVRWLALRELRELF